MSAIVDLIRQGEARWDLQGDQALGHLGVVTARGAGERCRRRYQVTYTR